MKKIAKKCAAAVLILCMLLPMMNVMAFSEDYPNTWVNTGDQQEDIVQIALTQVGYQETDDNHTKYAYWYYGSDESMPWCSIFISWCANQAGIPEKILHKNALASGYSVDNMSANDFGGKAIAFADATAQPGDIIYVDSNDDGFSNHCGLVVGSDDDYIYTVEGNYSEQVSSVRYDIVDGYRVFNSGSKSETAHIVFFSRPAYQKAGSQEEIVETPEEPEEIVIPDGIPYKVTASSLNLRKGPGTSYDAVGSVAKNQMVYVQEYCGGWARVLTGTMEGYVSMAYASFAGSDEERFTELVKYDKKYFYYEDGNLYTKGYKELTVDGEKCIYYFKSNGQAYSGGYLKLTIDGAARYFYFQGNGRAFTGGLKEVNIDGKPVMFYFKGNGQAYCGGYLKVTVDGTPRYYYFKGNGQAYGGGYLKVTIGGEPEYFYFKGNGQAYCGGYLKVTIGGEPEYFYFKDNGRAFKDGLLTIPAKDGSYFFQENGRALKSAKKTVTTIRKVSGGKITDVSDGEKHTFRFNESGLGTEL